MGELTVYENPTCTKCRDLVTLLEERGIPFERIDYQVDPLPEDRIRELLDKAGIGPQEALRTNESIYGELGLADREVGDAELISLMAEHPTLLQRPIVERGDRAVVARPATRVVDLLDD